MPNEKNYNDQLALFNEKYQMGNFDLSAMMEVGQKFQYMQNFTMGTEAGGSVAEQFIYFATKTLATHFERATILNDDGKYISKFNAQEFLDDYEDLATALYASKLQEGEIYLRDKYAGAKSKNIQNAFQECAKTMNKTLPTIWQERLKKGSMDVDELQRTTERSMTALNARALDSAQLQGHLTNVVAAYEAMQQLRKSREGFFGWFWKLFNRDQNTKEESCFRQLGEEIEQLKATGVYKVESLRNALNNKTILGIAAKNKENAVKIEPVLVALNHKRNDVWFKGKFAKECFNAIPENAQKVVSETLIKFTMSTPIFNQMDKLNDRFDDGIKNGNDPKVEMERIVKSIFKTVTHATEAFAEDLSNPLKLATAKAIAKVTINTLTAASIYPNELGVFVDEFIEDNAQQYQEIADDYHKEVARIQEEQQREQAFIDNAPFAENDLNKSEQVSQELKQNVPTMSNGNK